jgi:hypothetical protein
MMAGAATCGGIPEIRRNHSITDRREMVSGFKAKPGRVCLERMGSAASDDPCCPLPIRPKLSAQDFSSTQQRRIPARAAAGPALRQPRQHQPIPPTPANRTGMVPDRTHKRGRDLNNRILLTSSPNPPQLRTRHPNGILAHVSSTQRQHQLLRNHRRRRRRSTSQTQLPRTQTTPRFIMVGGFNRSL